VKSLIPFFAVTLVAGAAVAQPAPQSEPLGGPQVAGVCLLSQQAVLANAKVGVAATARLKQIAEATDAELVAQRQPLEAEAKTLQAQQASLKPADFEARRQSLGTRAQALEQTAEERRRELDATREKAVTRIAAEAQPVIAQVYKAHGCGLLVDRNSVLGGNMSGDLTAAVVLGLDAKITTITFEREILPTQTASNSAGAGAAPQ
jgi:Skp family chaperone for outer membrane proteins